MKPYQRHSIRLTQSQFNAVLALTRIESESVTAALKAHFVDGLSKAEAARQFNVNKGLLTVRSQRIHEVFQRARAFCQKAALNQSEGVFC